MRLGRRRQRLGDEHRRRCRRPSGLKVGIKFDQPGLGLKKGSEYTGFDVDVAKYVAKELGTDAADINWVQAPSAQRETLIETGQVDMVVATYSITDARKEKVAFAGPYFIAGQDLLVRADDTSITGPDTLDGKKLCSVTGSTSAQKVKDKYPGVQLQEFAHLLRVPARPRHGRRRRADHGRHDPRRLRRAARVQGQVQGRRQAVLRGELRHRPQEGRHRQVREDQRRDQEDGHGRLVAEGRRRQPRPGRLQAGRRQPADARPPAPDGRRSQRPTAGCRPPLSGRRRHPESTTR